jgi:hypothetical protein
MSGPSAPASDASEHHSPPASEVDAPAIGLRERARIRGRVRYLRKLREIQLRDLGGFVLELERFRRSRPELVKDKVAAAAETDRELRALEAALRERRPLREVREPGIGGACAGCGTVHGSSDRFCSWCGCRL